MYHIGEKIMYGNTGVCIVEEIQKDRIVGTAETREYYVLRPLYQSGIIRIPVDNGKVRIRPVLTREEAETILDEIPGLEVPSFYEKNLSALRNHYQDQINSFDCRALIRMAISIQTKRREVESRQKKIGLTDEKYLRRAEELLFGELAVALDIPRDQVPGYIRQRLGAHT